jgi:tetratricopeptide (TPR) repeat protein
MKVLTGSILTILVLVTLAPWPTSEARADTAAELIEQARQYDCGYSAGPDAGQRQALETYRRALAAQPEPPQRLHILFRMAQLHSCAYRIEKGETPNYAEALRLYQQIVASYSPEEPLVLQATTAAADCLVSLGRFDEALHWSRQALKPDTKMLEERIKALEEKGGPDHAPAGTDTGVPPADPGALRRTLRQMQRTQCAAVDQIAYAALQVSPLLAQIQLRTIAEQHAGTCIARRARQLLERHADQMSDVLALSETLPPAADTSILQSAAPSASLAPRPGDVGLPAATPAAPAPQGAATPGPGPNDKPLAERVPARWPRGPPLTRTQRVMATVAGLALIVLATRRFLRGSLRKE